MGHSTGTEGSGFAMTEIAQESKRWHCWRVTAL